MEIGDVKTIKLKEFPVTTYFTKIITDEWERKQLKSAKSDYDWFLKREAAIKLMYKLVEDGAIVLDTEKVVDFDGIRDVTVATLQVVDTSVDYDSLETPDTLDPHIMVRNVLMDNNINLFNNPKLYADLVNAFSACSKMYYRYNVKSTTHTY